MNKKKKIPTIIGLILLIFGLAAGVILVSQPQIFKLGATGETAPRNVRISDIASTSVSISWVTDIKTSGFVKYGEGVNTLTSTQTEEGTTESFTHLAKLSGLKPQTAYFFKINSGGEDFDNNGVTWQTQTLSNAGSAPTPTLISGSVLLSTGSPSVNSLVYVNIAGSLFATLTSQNGSWVIPINLLLDEKSTLLEISVQGGPSGISSAQIYPQSAKPVPSMILGQTYDFKNLPASEGADVPTASLGIPEESTPSSGFTIPEGTATPSATTVVLTSITNNEIVKTTTPEFFGEGPAGTKIQITVNSEAITTSLTIPSSGEWSWDIPKDLPEGNHTITISWKDASGVLRTLTRKFTVQASEGPAFVATPSATLKATATPTATPKATIKPKATATGTPFPQPQSGSLTPTILLSIMGIGIISFAFMLWKKSEI